MATKKQDYQLVNANKMAEMLGVSMSTFYRHIDSGMPVCKIGSMMRFYPCDVLAWAKNAGAAANPANGKSLRFAKKPRQIKEWIEDRILDFIIKSEEPVLQYHIRKKFLEVDGGGERLKNILRSLLAEGKIKRVFLLAGKGSHSYREYFTAIDRKVEGEDF